MVISGSSNKIAAGLLLKRGLQLPSYLQFLHYDASYLVACARNEKK